MSNTFPCKSRGSQFALLGWVCYNTDMPKNKITAPRFEDGHEAGAFDYEIKEAS
jgi:hypothetical protein